MLDGASSALIEMPCLYIRPVRRVQLSVGFA